MALISRPGLYILPRAVAGLLSVGVTVAYLHMGMTPAVILGGSGLVAFVLWHQTYLREPTDPAIMLPLFLATVAGFEIHLVEEYLSHYAPAISRLFGIGWTERSFVVICNLMAGGLSLVAVGLYRRNRLAGFVAWFFLVSRLAEFGLFVFPFIRPAVGAGTIDPLSQRVAGEFVADMPNYYFMITRQYYFAGMYTVALPILPALYAIYRLWPTRAATVMEKASDA